VLPPAPPLPAPPTPAPHRHILSIHKINVLVRVAHCICSSFAPGSAAHNAVLELRLCSSKIVYLAQPGNIIAFHPVVQTWLGYFNFRLILFVCKRKTYPAMSCNVFVVSLLLGEVCATPFRGCV